MNENKTITQELANKIDRDSLNKKKVPSLNELLSKKTAIVFGTFAPMHRGHIHLINKAMSECKSVKVIVSGYKGDRGDLAELDLQKRFRYIREVFADNDLVEVFKLDEVGLPPMPSGWDVWLDRLMGIVDPMHLKSKQEFVFYVSEEKYEEELSKRGYFARYGERNFDISATKIRNNPAKHWNFIAKPFRGHFSKKVLILGSASNGKTQLARKLANYFACPFSPEYSREYQHKNDVRDSELVGKDYRWLLMGQNQQTSDLIDGDGNNGLVIADTNSIVTKAYFDYFVYDLFTQELDNVLKRLSEISPDDAATAEEYAQLTVYKEELESDAGHYDSVNHLYKSIVSEEKWDLILFVEPTGTYVNDGYRNMDMADDETRDEFSNLMLNLLKTDFLAHSPKTKLVHLNGSYFENYREAIYEIKQIYKEY